MQSQPVVIQRNDGAGLLIRALYFVLIGWWFSAVWAVAAWVLCVTIIGLPLGLYMLDLVITPAGQVVRMEARQLPFLLRAIYFVLIGWWLSAIWLAIAWALHVSIIGMLLGFWMFNRTPAIVSLAR
jgi:uncharacterized membrane protein YccF (DUF307 family)